MQTTPEQKKVKFATQADPEVLAALRKLAEAEGRQLQALVDEALREYIDRSWAMRRGGGLWKLCTTV